MRQTMSKIINFDEIPGAYTQPNPENTTPDTVLTSAINKLNFAIVLGIQKDTHDIYFASSGDDVLEINFILDVAKKHIMDTFNVSSNT